MNSDDLISELLQGLTTDVQYLKTQVAKLPTQPPADYRASIETLTQSVQALGQQSAKPVPEGVDLSQITTQLNRIEKLSKGPDYKMSRAVQYGSYAFGLMAILVGVLSYYAFKWKGEKELYEQAHAHDNWRVRYTKQVDPDYYAYMEGVFNKDPAKTYEWILEQEQADQKRELARKAAEQAKALSDQANQLEGKGQTTGKKKR